MLLPNVKMLLPISGNKPSLGLYDYSVGQGIIRSIFPDNFWLSVGYLERLVGNLETVLCDLICQNFF